MKVYNILAFTALLEFLIEIIILHLNKPQDYNTPDHWLTCHSRIKQRYATLYFHMSTIGGGPGTFIWGLQTYAICWNYFTANHF